MDMVPSEAEVMVLASAAMLLLLTSNQVGDVPNPEEGFDDLNNILLPGVQESTEANMKMHALTRIALHSFRLSNVVALLGDELGFWVKPRSTTWFSRFLLDQYDEARWVKMFRMSKTAVFSLAELLKPVVHRRDTRYRLAIPVVVRVACALFKLSHGASLLICSELFAVGRSTVSVLLRDVVYAVNTVLRAEIAWPTGERLLQTEADFRRLSGLPGVVGAIDGTQVSISKPRVGASDYYYFKSGGYSLNCQAVVDSRKRFLDLFLGMPGSTNDSRMLRRSTLYHRAMQNRLWNAGFSFNGFLPFLVGDSGYPLFPWLLVPHRAHINLPLAENLFNRKMRRARCVVENAFGLLKQSFRELLIKSDLHVTFLLDVIVACAILHNIIQGQPHQDVERLLDILRQEGWDNNSVEEDYIVPEAMEVPMDDMNAAMGVQKRSELGVWLALQRQLPV